MGYCFWNFFRAMRVVYGQSRARTFAKYAVLGVTYFGSAVVLTMLTLAYTVLIL